MPLKYNDELKLELKATKQRVKEHEQEIDELHENIDTLEQYTRKNSLEIEGIPEKVCNDEDAVLKVAEALNINVKREDIDICHRIKTKKTSPIIARFICQPSYEGALQATSSTKKCQLLEALPEDICSSKCLFKPYIYERKFDTQARPGADCRRNEGRRIT